MGVRVRALVVFASLALAAGCGGGEEEGPVVMVPPDPFAEEAGEGVKRVDGRFSVGEVISAYREDIGVPLRVDERGPGYVALTTLPGPPFAPIAPDLGLFTVYVADSEAEADALVGRSGLAEEEGAVREPGVRFVADSALVHARARFGNVVLDWNADDLTQTDERFQRLASPLESLGGERPNRPAMNACAKEEGTGEPSAASGDPTCRLGPQVITFAPADATLEFGDLAVSFDGDPEFTRELEHQREDLSVGPDPRKPPETIRSKGEFMILRLDVENAGDETVERLPAALLVGERLFQPNLDDAFYVDKTNSPFPLAGGASGTAVMLFDLPVRVAQGLAEGSDSAVASLVLVDPRDPHSLHVPGSAPTVARLSLFD